MGVIHSGPGRRARTRKQSSQPVAAPRPYWLLRLAIAQLDEERAGGNRA
jgi:hypothetical protein